MTAVAPPPNFQNINNRASWGSSNGVTNGTHQMNGDDLSRMLSTAGPRKTATRTNSSSSLSSVSSTTSTATTGSTGSASATNTNGDAARRKPSRYPWPMAKAEPSISAARPQPVTSTAGASQAPAFSNMQTQGPILNSVQMSQQAAPRGSLPNETTAVLYLTPMNGTFERKTISVPFYPDVIKIGRQTNAKTLPTPYNGYFDSKVLSRSHAEVWADRNGKVWIRDIKSSNGTFVNGHRLSQENKDSDPHELRDQDMLELGIDIVSEDQKTVVHHKVAARVEHAGFVNSSALLDLNMQEMDGNNPHAQMINQAMGHIRRKSGQSDLAPMRNQMGAPGQQVQNGAAHRPSIWLAPITMEAAIKKLTAEYKMAKQQATELQRSTQFLDSIINSTAPPPPRDSLSPIGLSAEPRKAPSPTQNILLKPRFSEPPPNPPPSAPLPEKPDMAAIPSFLRRSDTEKPKIPNGSAHTPFRVDPSTATQIATLSDALVAAKKEVESQSKRLRDMEDMLVQERVKRENAEARAKTLEESGAGVQKLTNGTSPKENDENQSSTPIEDEANSAIGMKQSKESTTEKLQRQLDLILAEFQEYKVNAEKWKSDKEQAEKERDDERKERVSLSDMVKKLREEEQQRQEKLEKKKQKRRSVEKVDSPQESRAIEDNDPDEDIVADEDEDVDNSSPQKSKHASLSNGHLSSVPLLRALDDDGGTTKRQVDHLVQAAPYLSAMSVVLIGVAVMALVNKISKGEQ